MQSCVDDHQRACMPCPCLLGAYALSLCVAIGSELAARKPAARCPCRSKRFAAATGCCSAWWPASRRSGQRSPRYDGGDDEMLGPPATAAERPHRGTCMYLEAVCEGNTRGVRSSGDHGVSQSCCDLSAMLNGDQSRTSFAACMHVLGTCRSTAVGLSFAGLAPAQVAHYFD